MWRNTNTLNVLLLAAVVVCALSVVTSQHKARKLYVDLQEQKEFAEQMEVEWGQLQLEQRTFSTPAQLEKVAVQQLRMQPISGQIRYIQVAQRPPFGGYGAEIAAGATGETSAHLGNASINKAQVAGYLPQARNETVGPSPPGMENKSYQGASQQP